jgi:hypothetical protein
VTVGILITLAIALFLGGISLVARGLRGRRIDDHPLCERCGFDLTGKPQGSDICSECGAELSGSCASTLDTFEIWDGEIVLKEVPFPSGP